MNEQISAVHARLLRVDFLSKAGSKFDRSIAPLEPLIVESWKSAVSTRDTDASSDSFTEGANRLTRRLGMDFRREYRNWNTIIQDATVLFERDLFATIDSRVDTIHDLKAIRYGQELVKEWIRWDILHFTCEQAYSTLVDPGFYSCIIEVYEAGHFVCNWDEIWPNGKIWVF